MTKRRLTQQAKSDVEESLDAIADYEQQIADLGQERDAAIEEINDRWGDVVNDVSEITVTPKKADIFVNLFGVGWMPYYLVQSGEETMEVAAFGKE